MSVARVDGAGQRSYNGIRMATCQNRRVWQSLPLLTTTQVRLPQGFTLEQIDPTLHQHVSDNSAGNTMLRNKSRSP